MKETRYEKIPKNKLKPLDVHFKIPIKYAEEKGIPVAMVLYEKHRLFAGFCVHRRCSPVSATPRIILYDR